MVSPASRRRPATAPGRATRTAVALAQRGLSDSDQPDGATIVSSASPAARARGPRDAGQPGRQHNPATIPAGTDTALPGGAAVAQHARPVTGRHDPASPHAGHRHGPTPRAAAPTTRRADDTPRPAATDTAQNARPDGPAAGQHARPTTGRHTATHPAPPDATQLDGAAAGQHAPTTDRHDRAWRAAASAAPAGRAAGAAGAVAPDGAGPAAGRRRRGALAAAAAAAAAVLLAAPATAAAAPQAPVSDGAQLSAMTTALRADPVLVDPSMAYLFTPAQRAALDRAVRGAAFRTYLVVMPSFDQDHFDGSSDVMRYRLSRKLGSGLYLSVDQNGGVQQTANRVPRETFDVEDERTDPKVTGAAILGQVRTELRELAAAPHDDYALPADAPYDPDHPAATAGSDGDDTSWGDLLAGAAVIGVGGYLLLMLLIGLVRKAMRLPFRMPRPPRRYISPNASAAYTYRARTRYRSRYRR